MEARGDGGVGGAGGWRRGGDGGAAEMEGVRSERSESPAPAAAAPVPRARPVPRPPLTLAGAVRRHAVAFALDR